jgi:hypothetical protein
MGVPLYMAVDKMTALFKGTAVYQLLHNEINMFLSCF